ncbi:hypothetical protein N7925_34435 [Streptomyces sp. CA-278952]|uniref:hypothetical protein n=1 Tax=Streptomyces sp. CA-278952 TaxID=2980556 RepID=UPI0023688581|nr:hypothetical protein [Streptomyces sp. CA-278952]WDG33070.1 hypothetical protein N7925_34435 [Streptomyces sp. CA-278952]
MALDAILDGVPFVAVGALVGAKRDAFYRLRRGNLRLGALFGAAQSARRRTMAPGRKKKAELKGYRLVRIDAPPAPGADPVR